VGISAEFELAREVSRKSVTKPVDVNARQFSEPDVKPIGNNILLFWVQCGLRIKDN
jgi:hypothetical protein